MSSKFLVTVIGSQNTGKTTFINDIIAKYSDTPIYEPFVTDKCDYRKVIEEKKLSINREGNIESQKIIFNCLRDQVVNSICNPSYKNVIFDRSPIDAFVYTYYLYDKGKATKDDIKEMAYQMSKFASLYDAIIYIPLSSCEHIEVVNDKFRDTDIEYRKYIDMMFDRSLVFLDQSTYKKVYKIISDSREERLREFYGHFHTNFILKDTW